MRLGDQAGRGPAFAAQLRRDMRTMILMGTKNQSVKDQMVRLIQEQPEDSSYDEILRELAFARMVERGLADSEAGRTTSHEEMKRVIESSRK